jgi:isocitrate dehydrogenase
MWRAGSALVRQAAARGAHARCYSAASSAAGKISAPPMVYIKGEEMTRYTMQLVLDQWINPKFNTSKWEYFDLSCKNRDDSEDKVLHDAVSAGSKLCAIFKEPTITPSAAQKEKFGLKKTWGSPNGAMRKGWNGITISRDTIHIKGMELGFKNPVLFERQAVGGEYQAGYSRVGKGRAATFFFPEDGGVQIVDERVLKDNDSAVVTYSNPLDNVVDLAHHFFNRCLDGNVTPYVVTKKTVFKWQEGFWVTMNDVFQKHYKEQFKTKGLLEKCGGDLQHLISDAATMQIVRWTDGGFGMAAHNYDGDMLTDQIAQMHRSPGFMTSNLIGKREDGVMIKEFEASHGTVSDMDHARLRGEETSLNPLGMVEALIGAMQHAAMLEDGPNKAEVIEYTDKIRTVMHGLMVSGKGTRDLSGPTGLTTEEFVAEVSKHLLSDQPFELDLAAPAKPVEEEAEGEDKEFVKNLFNQFDTDGNGTIDLPEFEKALRKMRFVPKKTEFEAKA